MIRSKYIFLILAVVYIGIAIGAYKGLLIIGDMVLLGLSAASLFISLGDLINTAIDFLHLRNSYNYSIKHASDYLQQKISEGHLYFNSIDVCNVKESIDSLRTISNPSHPAEYQTRKRFNLLRGVSILLFVVAISCFITASFYYDVNSDNDVSKYITLLAFASMCGNIHLADINREIESKYSQFVNDKHSFIETMFPGYIMQYNNTLYHRTSTSKILFRKVFSDRAKRAESNSAEKSSEENS